MVDKGFGDGRLILLVMIEGRYKSRSLEVKLGTYPKVF